MNDVERKTAKTGEMAILAIISLIYSVTNTNWAAEKKSINNNFGTLSSSYQQLRFCIVLIRKSSQKVDMEMKLGKIASSKSQNASFWEIERIKTFRTQRFVSIHASWVAGKMIRMARNAKKLQENAATFVTKHTVSRQYTLVTISHDMLLKRPSNTARKCWLNTENRENSSEFSQSSVNGRIEYKFEINARVFCNIFQISAKIVDKIQKLSLYSEIAKKNHRDRKQRYPNWENSFLSNWERTTEREGNLVQRWNRSLDARTNPSAHGRPQLPIL